MPSYSKNIPLPIAIVWKHFLLKINHPENFVPGVSNVIIKEKNENFVVRAMDIALPSGTATVVEKITATPYTVKFLIVEHPVFTGYVDNVAEMISENETKITYSLNWVNKATGEPMLDEEIVKNAVLKSIDFMLKEL